MLADLLKVNPAQGNLSLDDSPYSVATCPRRAGKSYAGAAMALLTGEAKPGSISIVISLNLKQLRRLYWNGSPSGLFTIARQYGLNIEWNNSMLSWRHENGSIGYLLGADDDEQLEVIRGLEADLYLIDECKSFPPVRLEKLITDIITPQRATRNGRVVMIGTPGQVKAGPFWEASDPTARDADGKPYSVAYGEKDPHGRTPKGDWLWSRHHWTLEANSAKPHQWAAALITKRKNKWADDHPTWRREYLGEWAVGGDGLVYEYGNQRAGGRVTWSPSVTKDNPTGLPFEGAPWRLIGGMDLGFQEPTALVIAGYSSRLRQLRHVWDFKASHLVVDEVIELLAETYSRFPQGIEKIFVDGGGLGKMVLESILRAGYPVERADKREKWDHIELLNSAFVRGEVQIIPGTELEHQLLTNAWDLDRGTQDEVSRAKAEKARAGRLREDDAIPNDLADAFLYLYRGSLHQFGYHTAEPEPAWGSSEWVAKRSKEELRRMRERLKHIEAQRFDTAISRAPAFVVRALEKANRWNRPPSAPTS